MLAKINDFWNVSTNNTNNIVSIRIIHSKYEQILSAFNEKTDGKYENCS